MNSVKHHIYFLIALITLMFVSTHNATAQEIEGRKISGMLLEKGSANTRIGDAIIKNLRTKQEVVSSTMGIFSIDVQIGDSLSVSKTGYGPIKTHISTLEDIILDMQPGLEIETVVVTRQSREAELRGYLDDYRKKGVYNGGHNSVGTYIASPATALYNLFGKEPRNAKRFEKYMEVELEQRKIDRIFNKTIVSSLTSLEGEELRSFMDIYRPSISMVERWGEYDLVSYINSSFKAWDKNGRPKSERLPKLDIPEQEK